MWSCISNQPVLLSSKDIPDLIDHRNFYNKYDPEAEVHVGYSACGLSRNVVAKMLLASDVFFGDTDFLKSLPQYIKNPSVTGFMMEMAILSSIASTGLKLTELKDLKIPAVINCPMQANLFLGRIPNLDSNTENPVLLIPQAWNFRAIDGVIVQKESKRDPTRAKRRLFGFLLQVTLAETHSDSHQTIFSEWGRWIDGLDEFEVVPTFVWIQKEAKGKISHRTDPRHYELHIPIRQSRRRYRASGEYWLILSLAEIFTVCSR